MLNLGPVEVKHVGIIHLPAAHLGLWELLIWCDFSQTTMFPCMRKPCFLPSSRHNKTDLSNSCANLLNESSQLLLQGTKKKKAKSDESRFKCFSSDLSSKSSGKSE